MDAQVLELIAIEHAQDGLEQETPSAEQDDAAEEDAGEEDSGEEDSGEEAGEEGVSGEGASHCGLCELTADDAWECLGDELGVGVRLHDSLDLAPEEQQIVREVGTPCVLARFDNADLHPVVLAERLEVFEGDVSRLVREIRLVADQQGWALPGAKDRDEEPTHEEI